MNKIQPIDIILCTYNRLNFLKHTVQSIYKNTKYPYRLWVIDNNSTDGTQHWLKTAKAQGFIYEHIFNKENEGLAGALTIAFGHIKKSKDGISEWFITTQDDCSAPDLQPCWLERLLHLAEKYYPEYGAIAMRTQRIRRRRVDELKELIDSPTSLASFFRIQNSKDIDEVGGFSKRKHWESPQIAENMKQLKKKIAVATHLYCSDDTFMEKNKGFDENNVEYFTYSKERVNQGELQPFPDIDPKTLIPLKTNTPRDDAEQKKRDEFYDYWGRDFRKTFHKSIEQTMLAEYVKKGVALDLGCGKVKCHENALGVDVFPFDSVDVLHDCCDLWMFKDNSIDALVSSHVLEHIPDFIKVLKEWRRVLKPGGIMAHAVPDGELKPRYILKSGHKNNIGLETLKIVFKHKLKMDIIKAEQVPKNNPNKFVALIVAKKR